jgi:hypothetical protein
VKSFRRRRRRQCGSSDDIRHLPVDDRLESAADKSAEPVPHEVSVARIRTLRAESKANVLH